CEETEQVAHALIVSGRCSSSEAGHVRCADSGSRYGAKRRVSTDRARSAGDGDSGIVAETVSSPDIAAEFESVFTFGPAQRVAVGHQNGGVVIRCRRAAA